MRRIYLSSPSKNKSNTKHTCLGDKTEIKTNAGEKKKSCIEIDVLRQRVTAETLGMGSSGGYVEGR